MSIAVKLEFVFDNADEVIDLLGQLAMPEQSSTRIPKSSYQARIERTEAQAQPLMDMLTSALAQKGLHAVRLQDLDKQDGKPE
jgi:hypothetical protein